MNPIPAVLRVLLLVLAVAAAPFAFGQATERPFTVAPGHFLLEMDALSLTFNKDGGNDYTAIGVATTFITTGVASNVDVQLGAQAFINQKVESGSFTDRRSGIGDLYGRVKWKFFDQGGTAVAIMPYVKVPTNSSGVGNDSVEGGVIVPWSTHLLTGLEVAAMAELEFRRNPADDGYDTFMLATAYAKQPLVGGLSLYGEATMGKSSGGEPFAGTVGVGATLAVNSSIWWDYAMYKGLSHGAADWNHVLRFNFAF